MTKNIERCLEGELLLERDERGRVAHAHWQLNSKRGYPHLALDHSKSTGTLRWAVEEDRFEKGVLREQEGHPWGDPGESTRKISMKRWLAEALNEMRANMLSVLCTHHRGLFTPSQATEVVRYVEEHRLAKAFPGNVDVYPRALLVLAEHLAHEKHRDQALRRYEEAIAHASSMEQMAARVLASAESTLGKEATAHLHDHLRSQRYHVKDSRDDLLLLGKDRPSEPHVRKLMALLDKREGLETTWGKPAKLDAAKKRWRQITNVEMPISFADFLENHDRLLVAQREGTKATNLIDLFDPSRWENTTLDIYDFAGTKTHRTNLVVFAHAFKIESARVVPRRCAFVLVKDDGDELQCGWLSGGDRAKYYLDRHLTFASWLEDLTRNLRILFDEL